MLTLSKLSAAALVSATLVSANSQAAEVSLKEYANAMIAQALQTTIQEIKLSVQTDILTAANAFDLESNTLLTKVTITDIPAGEESDAAEQESEKSE